MIDIFKTILDVAGSLLGVADKLRGAERQRRADMATLSESISDCLAAVATEIRAGGVPHGRCGELDEYARALPALIADEVGELRARELGDTLRSAYNVESVAMNLQRPADTTEKARQLAQIEEAGGKFRALANLLRAG